MHWAYYIQLRKKKQHKCVEDQQFHQTNDKWDITTNKKQEETKKKKNKNNNNNNNTQNTKSVGNSQNKL